MSTRYTELDNFNKRRQILEVVFDKILMELGNKINESVIILMEKFT